jgi:nitroreductase
MSTRQIKIYTNKLYSLKNIDSVLEQARIFARSYGLQPLKILEIKDADLIAKLLSGQNNPKKSRDTLHLVVLAIKPVITSEHIDDFISDIRASKKTTGHSLNNYRRHIESLVNRKEGALWPSRQAYQALDILSSSAKDAGAGIRLIADFNTEVFDEALSLRKDGFTAHIVVLLSLSESRSVWPSAHEANN